MCPHTAMCPHTQFGERHYMAIAVSKLAEKIFFYQYKRTNADAKSAPSVWASVCKWRSLSLEVAPIISRRYIRRYVPLLLPIYLQGGRASVYGHRRVAPKFGGKTHWNVPRGHCEELLYSCFTPALLLLYRGGMTHWDVPRGHC